MRPHRAISVFMFLPAALLAQDIEMQAELMNRVGTETSRKGDLISARVLFPAALEGDIVEGKVNESKSGAKMGGKAALSLTFETLRHRGQVIPISSQVKSMTNSKGQMDTDEEGRVIRGTNNVPKALAGTGAGALIGGLIGGGKGAAIGAAAGAVGSIVLIQVASDGPNIRLDPGSRVNLMAKSRGEPSLASLAPTGTPVAAQPVAAQPVVAAPVATAPAVASQPTAAPAPSQPATQNGPQASAQPNLTAIKSDFIPGEKTIFLDDFTDMAGDEPPPHWKVRGGVAELRVGGGVRQLTFSKHGMVLTANVKGLPKNFTMEADLKFEGAGGNGVGVIWRFMKKDGYQTLAFNMPMQLEDESPQHGASRFMMMTGDPRESPETVANLEIKVNPQQPVQVGLWVQDGRLRFYANGTRVVDVNQVKLEDIEYMEVEAAIVDQAPEMAMGFRRVRLAESAPDFSKTIVSSGRFVTHGILFDTDSDRIKPESAPVIRQIARGFETNPSLKMLIEGHTDSTGNAAHNMDLSKRRAEAVKAVLVSQFNVDASRLTTAGLGATKPMDTNDTPAGRAQNRRVEFVRQ